MQIRRFVVVYRSCEYFISSLSDAAGTTCWFWAAACWRCSWPYPCLGAVESVSVSATGLSPLTLLAATEFWRVWDLGCSYSVSYSKGIVIGFQMNQMSVGINLYQSGTSSTEASISKAVDFFRFERDETMDRRSFRDPSMTESGVPERTLFFLLQKGKSCSFACQCVSSPGRMLPHQAVAGRWLVCFSVQSSSLTSSVFAYEIVLLMERF